MSTPKLLSKECNYFFPLRTFLCGGDTQALPQPSTQWPDTKSDECRTTAIGIYVSTDRALCALGETDPHNAPEKHRARRTADSNQGARSREKPLPGARCPCPE